MTEAETIQANLRKVPYKSPEYMVFMRQLKTARRKERIALGLPPVAPKVTRERGRFKGKEIASLWDFGLTPRAISLATGLALAAVNVHLKVAGRIPIGEGESSGWWEHRKRAGRNTPEHVPLSPRMEEMVFNVLRREKIGK